MQSSKGAVKSPELDGMKATLAALEKEAGELAAELREAEAAEAEAVRAGKDPKAIEAADKRVRQAAERHQPLALRVERIRHAYNEAAAKEFDRQLVDLKEALRAAEQTMAGELQRLAKEREREIARHRTAMDALRKEGGKAQDLVLFARAKLRDFLEQ